MPDPQSSIARFGVSLIGPKFEFAHLVPIEGSDPVDYEVVNGTYRAHPGMGFDEQVEYTRLSAMLQAVALLQARDTNTALKIVAEVPEDEAEAALRALADQQIEEQRERWHMRLQLTLMLVAPVDREKLGPILERSNPDDVRGLQDYLEQLVMVRDKKLVEVAGGVDPTSQPSSAG